MVHSGGFKIASCYGKARFDNEKRARSKANEYGLRYYYCDVCGGFHLTSKAETRLQKDFSFFKNREATTATSTKEHKCHYCGYTILRDTKYKYIEAFNPKEKNWGRFKFHNMCYEEMMEGLNK
jgi:DNA-directed RNA polymerase subunit RPC12/RpoP